LGVNEGRSEKDEGRTGNLEPNIKKLPQSGRLLLFMPLKKNLSGDTRSEISGRHWAS
jgi:hypothetical protein